VYPCSVRDLLGKLGGASPIPGNLGTEQPGQASAGDWVVGLLLRSVRVFSQFAWLEVGSVKVVLSRPGRAPGCCAIPPTSTPRGA